MTELKPIMYVIKFQNLNRLLPCYVFYKEIPPHPNVVQTFGVSLDGPQPVIVLEYCAGDIKSNQIKSNQVTIFHLIV
jgi:hypothetical protein